MRFDTFTFVLFFAILLAAYQLPFLWRHKKAGLLIGSYLFYATWNPPFVLLLLFSTLVDWFVAHAMSRTEAQSRRKALLIISLVSNLGLLAFFKYGAFLLANFVAAAALLGVEFKPAPVGIVLPVGISFYTFQSLSYTIDVYRGDLEPGDSFLDFALFVSFFPQLVAGPIVRAVDFLPQCVEPRRTRLEDLGWGLTFVAVGLFEKVVLADYLLAPVADSVFSRPAELGVLDAWVGTLAFSGQIFCDFAGYSTCAIGVARCLGFQLTTNFRFPYAARGFSDFWRRWHISLSTWLRDYLYIPLGGNRSGPKRTYINLMLTMLLGGLWHGAAWHFVVWGGLHGLFLVVERLLVARFGGAKWPTTALGQICIVLGTYALVCLTWVFFRAESIGDAVMVTSAMCFRAPTWHRLLESREIISVLVVTVLLIGSHWSLRDSSFEALVEKTPWWARGLALAALSLAALLVPGDPRAFIYFQF